MIMNYGLWYISRVIIYKEVSCISWPTHNTFSFYPQNWRHQKRIVEIQLSQPFNNKEINLVRQA
uniref:Uncharacterized protein n=1 Tax=Lepeophtheirus salmonis TaxID=72036 RepID=A0A0K2VCT5_LEPSM